jgi:hypothetical protein
MSRPIKLRIAHTSWVDAGQKSDQRNGAVTETGRQWLICLIAIIVYQVEAFAKARNPG